MIRDCTGACSPVRVVPDPIRGGDNVLVMCEVLNPDGTPHETNTRAGLRELLTPDVIEQECLYGFEQVRTFEILTALTEIHVLRAMRPLIVKRYAICL